MTPPDLWTIEDACRNAYPAREIMLDGWLLRAAGGRSKRTNSVNPLRNGPHDPAGVVLDAAAIYAALGQVTIVRVPSFLPETDQSLDRLGFTSTVKTLTLWAAAEALPKDGGHAGMLLNSSADDAWLAAWRTLNPVVTPAVAAAFARSVTTVILPAAFAVRSVDGRPVALAYGVMHKHVMVIEAVAAAANHRRQGHARAVVQALLGWARFRDAVGACLQVGADNAPALALYRGIGFTEDLYSYHYRVAPDLHPE